MRTGIVVEVTAADRARLEAVVADRNSPQKRVWRAEIVLLTADGCGTRINCCTSIHHPVNGTPSWRQFMDKALYRAYVAVQQNNKALTIRDFGAVL